MKVLIACEYSGAVRDEFLKLGHDAHSCDILPCESKYLNKDMIGYRQRHYQQDVLEVINEGWDLMIAHPPCTHLAVSGQDGLPKVVSLGHYKRKLWNLYSNLWMLPLNASVLKIRLV